jgi:zinc transporter
MSTTQDKSTEPGLTHAFLINSGGSGRRLGWDELTTCDPGDDQWLWMHMDYSQPRVQQWIMESSGLPELTAEAILQAETRPRCTQVDGGLMLFLRGVNLNPGADPDDMLSIRMWVDEHKVYSLGMRHMLSVTDVSRAIDQGKGPASPGEFIVTLVDLLLDLASTVIEELYDQVDELEDAVLVTTDSKQRTQLSAIRRQAIALRRFLAPQREALNRLSVERTPILSDEHRMHLREDFDRLTRLVEDLDAARERAGVIHETLLSLMAEQTNQRMYVLSLVAAIFLPLSFLTGLLGINVGGIPGAESALGFAAVTIILLVISAGILAFFRWRNWF